MILVNRETKLHDVVIQEPAIVTVLNRFNITLGVGDKTVKQICDGHNLDTSFFLSILNTFINPDFFPEETLKACNISEIVEYLRKANDYYRKFLIPNVEQHFNLLISRSKGGNTNLELMRDFFFEVKAEMLAKIENDTTTLFPDTEKLGAASAGTGDITPAVIEGEQEDGVEDKLSDLISMIVIHLTGTYDTNLCQAVLFAIINLKKDVGQNNRIRNKILMPLYRAISSTAGQS